MQVLFVFSLFTAGGTITIHYFAYLNCFGNNFGSVVVYVTTNFLAP